MTSRTSDWRLRTERWRQLRRAVLVRDGGRCQIGASGCTVTAGTVDHVTPVSEGGDFWAPSNLRAACAHCNYSRSHPTRFRRRWLYQTTIARTDTRL